MSDLTLLIGNKNYSSWSLRPWIALRVKKIDFLEELVPFDEATHNAHFARFSPTGKVPVLKHGDVTIWESLAILEYLAECYPDAALWPDDRLQRAKARTISTEMHAGFGALRAACSMNMRRQRSALAVGEAVRRDVRRIETIWKQALAQSGGPFLFGAFTAADAMFAPVVNRFDVYDLTHDGDVTTYMQTMQSLPAWQEWQAAGRAEPWIVVEDEV